MSLSRRSLLAAAASAAATAAATDLSAERTRSNEVGTPKAEFPDANVFPKHAALGRGIGVMPGRVAWVHAPNAVHWTGEGYWWELEHYNHEVVRRMLERAIASLAGETVPAAIDEAPPADVMRRAWMKLFVAHNRRRLGNSSETQTGYRSREKIAVKVNMNGSGAYGSSAPGFTEESYGNAVLMRALLDNLVEHLGASPEDIVFYDAGRIFPNYLMQYVAAGQYEHVQFRHRAPGTALDAEPDRSARIRWAGSIRGEAPIFRTALPKRHTSSTSRTSKAIATVLRFAAKTISVRLSTATACALRKRPVCTAMLRALAAATIPYSST